MEKPSFLLSSSAEIVEAKLSARLFDRMQQKVIAHCYVSRF